MLTIFNKYNVNQDIFYKILHMLDFKCQIHLRQINKEFYNFINSDLIYQELCRLKESNKKYQFGSMEIIEQYYMYGMIHVIDEYKFDHPYAIIKSLEYGYIDIFQLVHNDQNSNFKFGKFIIKCISCNLIHTEEIKLPLKSIDFLYKLMPDETKKIIEKLNFKINIENLEWICKNINNPYIIINQIIGKLSTIMEDLEIIQWIYLNVPESRSEIGKLMEKINSATKIDIGVFKWMCSVMPDLWDMVDIRRLMANASDDADADLIIWLIDNYLDDIIKCPFEPTYSTTYEDGKLVLDLDTFMFGDGIFVMKLKDHIDTIFDLINNYFYVNIDWNGIIINGTDILWFIEKWQENLSRKLNDDEIEEIAKGAITYGRVEILEWIGSNRIKDLDIKLTHHLFHPNSLSAFKWLKQNNIELYSKKCLRYYKDIHRILNIINHFDQLRHPGMDALPILKWIVKNIPNYSVYNISLGLYIDAIQFHGIKILSWFHKKKLLNNYSVYCIWAMFIYVNRNNDLGPELINELLGLGYNIEIKNKELEFIISTRCKSLLKWISEKNIYVDIKVDILEYIINGDFEMISLLRNANIKMEVKPPNKKITYSQIRNLFYWYIKLKIPIDDLLTLEYILWKWEGRFTYGATQFIKHNYKYFSDKPINIDPVIYIQFFKRNNRRINIIDDILNDGNLIGIIRHPLLENLATLINLYISYREDNRNRTNNFLI